MDRENKRKRKECGKAVRRAVKRRNWRWQEERPVGKERKWEENIVGESGNYDHSNRIAGYVGYVHDFFHIRKVMNISDIHRAIKPLLYILAVINVTFQQIYSSPYVMYNLIS